jgi:two-component SAPR family response regulator
MPEMNGSDLSMKIRKHSQHLPILYISGYPADAVTEDGKLPPDIHYLAKPFDRLEILRKIDDMLHGQGSRNN